MCSHVLPCGPLGVVEEFHRMIPNHRFQHIYIEDYLSISDEMLCQHAMEVSPKGFPSLFGPYTPSLPRSEITPQMLVESLGSHGILQVCLLHSRLFIDCKNSDIRDLNKRPPKLVTCQDRFSLIDELTNG